VLPVGGIKEKALAAQRAGISRFVLPYRNEVDLDELPSELKDGMTFIPVRTLDEALGAVMPDEFHLPNPREEALAMPAPEPARDIAAAAR
jgi:ATP-dependent Lon protease